MKIFGLSISEIRDIVSLVIMILQYGKDVVEAMGDIIEEIRKWFRNEPSVQEQEAFEKAKESIEPILSATRLSGEATRKEVSKAASVLWNLDKETVDTWTRRVAKVSGARRS